jgi:hypothetical protein
MQAKSSLRGAQMKTKSTVGFSHIVGIIVVTGIVIVAFIVFSFYASH